MSGNAAIFSSSHVLPRQISGKSYFARRPSNHSSSPGVGSIGTTNVHSGGRSAAARSSDLSTCRRLAGVHPTRERLFLKCFHHRSIPMVNYLNIPATVSAAPVNSERIRVQPTQQHRTPSARIRQVQTYPNEQAYPAPQISIPTQTETIPPTCARPRTFPASQGYQQLSDPNLILWLHVAITATDSVRTDQSAQFAAAHYFYCAHTVAISSARPTASPLYPTTIPGPIASAGSLRPRPTLAGT